MEQRIKFLRCSGLQRNFDFWSFKIKGQGPLSRSKLLLCDLVLQLPIYMYTILQVYVTVCGLKCLPALESALSAFLVFVELCIKRRHLRSVNRRLRCHNRKRIPFSHALLPWYKITHRSTIRVSLGLTTHATTLPSLTTYGHETPPSGRIA